MTTPTPPTDPQQPAPPPQGHPIADTVAAAAIAAALAGIVGMPNLGSLPAADRRRVVTASGPGQQITAILNGQGIPTPVAQAVLGMTLGNNPIPHTSRRAPGTDAVRLSTQTTNLIRRAQYIQSAAARVARDYRDNVARAGSTTTDVGGVDALKQRRDALTEALRSEQPYWRQHVQAQQGRNKAARALDQQAALHGATLGWYALRGEDGRLAPNVTRACRQADGRNFTVGQPSPIGMPGLGPHVGCVAADTVVTSPRVLAATTRWYEGELLELHTVGGNFLSVTPNHPVLTPKGWVPAGLLNEGDDVVSAGLGESPAVAVDPDGHHVPTLVQDVRGALLEQGGVVSPAVPVTSEDLHGDALDGEIEIVWAAGVLMDDVVATEPQPRGVEQLGGVRWDASVPGLSGAALLLERLDATAGGTMSRLGVARMLLGRPSGHHDSVRVSLASPLDAGVAEDAADDLASDAVLLRQAELAFAGTVGGGDLVLGQALSVADSGSFASSPGPVVGGGLIPQRSPLREGDEQGSLGDVEPVGDGLVADVAALVRFDRLREIRRRAAWSGHVYNLETSHGWFVANGVVVHNCRCTSGPPHPTDKTIYDIKPD